MKNKFIIKQLQLSSVVPLTLADRRLFNYLLLHAFDQLSSQKKFIIDFDQLQGVYGNDLPSLEHLKKSIRRLTHTIIELEVKPKKWMMTSLLGQTELIEDENQIFYSFSSLCCQLFTDPVTLEKCLIQAHFIHKYSSLLYDILASAHYAHQLSYVIDLSDLRDRLQLSLEKFRNFGDFNRFVLMPAIDEINSYASFAIKFHTIRKGMKVLQIVFNITNKRTIPLSQAKSVIPPKRQQLFIEDPETERSYAYLLNAKTNERRKYFNLARKKAAKNHQTIPEELFDCPDEWFQWVKNHILKTAPS